MRHIFCQKFGRMENNAYLCPDINQKERIMNTISIDSDMYKGAAEYARRYNISIKEVVEHDIQLVIGTINANVTKRERSKTDKLGIDEAMEFVKTLSASGGSPVPADENGMDALIEEKYKL